MTRKELKTLLRDYPDVVSLPELCAMMGGIGDSTARKLLRSGRIKSLMVRSTYYIPKKCVIDYYRSLKKQPLLQIKVAREINICCGFNSQQARCRTE